MKRSLLLLGVLALLYPSLASAEPKNGLGLYIGATQQNGSIAVQGFSGSTSYTTDTDVGLGIDYQFKLASFLSLGIFGEITGGSTVRCSGCGSSTRVDNKFAGLELRFWFDSIFLGLRGGYMAETFDSSGGTSSDYSGTGIGATGGWAGDAWFAKLAIDTGNLSYQPSGGGAKQTDNVTVYRLYAGYRFGGN
jgi:hypothetical protein